MSRISRRDFVRSVPALTVLWPGIIAGASGPVIVLAGTRDPDTSRGMRLGAEEAARAAELVRRPLRFADAESVDPAAWPDETIAAVIAGTHVPPAAAVASRGVLRMDVRSVWDDDAEPATIDRLHTGAPARAYALVAEQAAGETALLWHASLFRYGAEQLNERYRRRFGTAMNGAAWAGWIGVKAIAETALRAVPADAPALAAALGEAEFDGHKGEPLHFDARGTLAQPMYVASGGEIREVPWPLADS